MIYLDNAATTPILQEALEVYNEYSKNQFFNASAKYSKAVEISSKIEKAKKTIARALGVNENSKIIFTSSATESNNLAIFGCIKSNFKKLVFSYAEHASVKNVAQELTNKGYTIEFIPLQRNGEINYEKLEEILDKNTGFISTIHISNETGAINDLKRINEIRKKKCPNAIFHADGVQAFSKIKINLKYFGIDLYTISGHKMFGPKGISALYVGDNINIKPIMYGGGQEFGIRSGTENAPCILAFEKAVELIGNINANYEYVRNLKNIFLENLQEVPYKLNSGDNCSPYIISISFPEVKGETLLHMLEQYDIFVSTSSACSSKKAGNAVLEAMGLSNSEAISSLRISFSKFNTAEEAIICATKIKECYFKLREILK
ncbi:MAG: cysteine desulfurase [Clostridia bacterium]|nr:cysteine desulfurase [Clostridia bacterium]